MSDTFKSIADLSPEEKRAYLAQLLRKKAKEGQATALQSTALTDWSSLSHGQRALWFLYKLAPESPAYNLIYTAHIRSPLDTPALQRALQALIQHNPILTATYKLHNDAPMQHFHPQQKIQLEIIDASNWRWEYLQQCLQEEGDCPFNLEQGPLLRTKLFMRTAQDPILSLTMHHIAVDFWSLDLLIEELSTLYSAAIETPSNDGQPQGSLSPQPHTLTYTDYIRWQADMLASPEGERLWTYWQQELAGELPLLNLPIDRPRPPIQTYRGASHSFQIGEELSQQLKTLAHSEKATPYMLLLAAFQALLFRYTDQSDILIGSTTLGRSRTDLQKIVGYLANPVVLRANFSSNPTFKELLSHTRHTVIAALEHQDYPFPLLVERLQPKRDASYSPLFQALFVWEKPRELATHTAQQKLRLEPYAFGQQGAPFDLTLRVTDIQGALSADFRYNIDLFDPATIARMEYHLRTLLAAIVAHPEQRISDLPLLTQEEQQQLLLEWNDTKSDYPDTICIHQLFESQVQQTPEAIALVFEAQELTYNQLNRQANRLAHALQAVGVGPDVLVGVCMERSLEMVIALLGILKAGGAYVPLDPTYPRERLDYMIHDAHMPVLLTQTRLLDLLPKDTMQLICLDSPDLQHTFALPLAGNLSEENPISNVQPDNLVYMIYTSGSTGKPKGVMNIHRSLSNRLHWMQQAYQLTPADHILQKTPFSFDVSVWEFFWPLLTGARLVVARPGGHQDPTYLVSIIAEQHITTLHFVPSMLQAFLMDTELQRCTNLKRVICSGEALTLELQERFFKHFDANSTELHNLYGPTEAAIDVTYWQCRPESNQWIVPIGYPIANTQIYILDRSHRPVPIGVPGELYIGGIGLARGYFNRPELTAEKFIPDPFNQQAGARLFKTGDLARYRADGAIEFLGRIDHQVKIRGFRIELGEIEVVLTQHPAIKEAVVVAREDTPGNKRLVAYLVSAAGAALSVETLRTFLSEKLPHYMLPAAFVFLEALPLQPNGKVNRGALPTPDTTRPKLEEAYVAPRNPAEEILARIWAQVLGIDKVGIHDNYFDLGGASIQSLQIIAKANEAGLQLTPELLFEHQTIAELAAVGARFIAPTTQPILASISNHNNGTNPHIDLLASHQPVQTGMANTLIESIGVYLPPKAVSSAEILQNCTNPLSFPLEQFTGINTRRMAGETEFSIDLAKQAVADCLANSKYTPQDIDLLICANISRCDGPNFHVSFEPSTSLQLKHHFGFTNAIVFDISNACTGMFTAASIIDNFLKAGLIRTGMVVSGEYISHITQTAQKEINGYMDSRLACLTVGDAGAAMILEQSPNNTLGFHQLDLYTLGRYSDYCIAKATDREHGGAIMYTDAVRVAAVNIQQAISHAAYTLERSGWQPEAFQHIIMHQTSKMSINDAAREINSYFKREICNQDNIIHNLADRGNTATTTHIVALMDHILSNRIRSGDNIIFGVTGSGATIGTALYTLDDLPERLRQTRQNIPKSGENTRKGPLQSPAKWTPLAHTKRVRIESIGTLPQKMQLKKEAVELAHSAAKNCLTNSAYSKNDIDLLIYAGVYRDDFLCEPAIAAILAGKLNMNDTIESQHEKKTFAFDLFNGAIGFLNACHLATGMIHAQKVKSVMVVASEIENNLSTHPQTTQAAPVELLGISETGSAVILDESSQTGFGTFIFKYFTHYIEAFAAYTVHRTGKTRMHFEKDPNIEAYYLQCIHDTVNELLSIEQLDREHINVILPPQVSSQFTAALSNKLNLSKDKFVDIAAAGSDLYTSSLPYTLQYIREHHLAKPGDIGLIISIGSGIQVGCATYYF